MIHFNLKGASLCGTKGRWDTLSIDMQQVTCAYCCGMLDSGIVADLLPPVDGTATGEPGKTTDRQDDKKSIG